MTEAEYTERAIQQLSSTPWAQPLLQRVANSGGVIASNKPLLFEVRFAYELSLAGATAEYEHAAGVGGSTIDFRVHGKRDWLVELVSVCESQALQRATEQFGEIYQRVLTTGASDPGQSEEGEMITALGKIGEKVFADGAPTKFPPPTSAIHAIVADMRSYCGHGGDAVDYQQMANGREAVSSEHAWTIQYWNGDPIRGLFERVENHPLRAAPAMQERVHFLGFIAESEYREGELRERAYYRPNPKLLPAEEEQIRAYQSFALARP